MTPITASPSSPLPWTVLHPPAQHIVSPHGNSASIQAVPKAAWWQNANNHWANGAFGGMEVEVKPGEVIEFGGNLALEGNKLQWIKFGIECAEPNDPVVSSVVCDPFDDGARYPGIPADATTTYSIRLNYSQPLSASPSPLVQLLINNQVVRQLSAFGTKWPEGQAEIGDGTGGKYDGEGRGAWKVKAGVTVAVQ